MRVRVDSHPPAQMILFALFLCAWPVASDAALKATDPSPPDGATGVTAPLMQWRAGDTAVLHKVYFGTNPTPGPAEFRSEQGWTLYWHAAGLALNTTYYWRIDEITAGGSTIRGDVWSFTSAGRTADNPDPPDGATSVDLDVVLSWSTGFEARSHDVYFGTDETAVTDGTGGTFKGNQRDETYYPGPLEQSSTYYWRIDERGPAGKPDSDDAVYRGQVWSFTTTGPPPELVVLHIEGPNDVVARSSAQYAAIARYDDESIKDVTVSADWWLDPSGLDSIDETGLLTVADVSARRTVTVHARYSEGQVTREAQKSVLCSPVTYHVDSVSGSDSNDGLTPETAFATIKKGIDTAQDGDMVLVYPGLYRESVELKGKAVILQSAEDAAVIESPGDFAVTFRHGEGPDTVLKNFVIQNSQTAVYVVHGSPTIANLTIVDNVDGIYAISSPEPNITNCILWENSGVELRGCEARQSWLSAAAAVKPSVGLSYHWKLNHRSGTTARDSVSGRHGTVHGAVWTTGFVGGALSFDGQDDYLALPGNAPVWLPEHDFTLSTWVYFERDPGSLPDDSEAILDLNFAISPSPHCKLGCIVRRLSDTGQVCFSMVTTTNPDEDLYTVQPPAEHEWCHIVAVRHGTTQAIYIDGHLDNSRACSPDPIRYVGDFDDDQVNLGRYTAAGGVPRRHLRGMLDDVVVFDRALSGEEVVLLYENALARHEDDHDPLFADPDNGDYHLLSERGRYWPEHDVWILDEVTSPCIDAGDATANFSNEPAPNGGRLNLGAYGGTAYASMSDWPLIGDVNQDGIVDMRDVALMTDNWLESMAWFE
ncbi:MAG: hypothetical protein JSU70_19190 [Phycisphaerales bacterium]|nr:MAG: hypothetical protein JSU70_19190 [Phycisphaerales bacterium]